MNIAYDEDKQMINRFVNEKEGGAEKPFQLLEDFSQVRIVPKKMKYRINSKYSPTLVELHISHFLNFTQ